MFPFCNLFGHQAGQASAKPAMQGSVITKLKAIHAGPDGIVVSRRFRILLFVGCLSLGQILAVQIKVQVKKN